MNATIIGQLLGNDPFDMVVKEANSGIETVNEVADLLQKRASIEENKAKCLQDLANQLSKMKQQQSLRELLDYLKTQYQAEADEAISFARRIKDQVVPQVQEVVHAQMKNSKSLYADGRKLNKQLNQSQSQLDASIQDYYKEAEKRCQHQIVHHSQKCLSDITAERFNSLTSNSDSFFRKINSLESQLKNSIYAHNQFLEGYISRMTKIMRDLDEQDQQRFQLLQQVIRESTHHPTSDHQHLDSLKPSNSAYAFENPPTPVTFHPYRSFVSESMRKEEVQWQLVMQINCDQDSAETYIDQDGESEQILLALDEELDEFEVMKREFELVKSLFHDKDRRLIYSVSKMRLTIQQRLSYLWSGSPIDLCQFRQLLCKNHVARYIWIQEIAKFRLNQRFEVTAEAYQAIVDSMNLALDICDEECDGFISRKLIHMSMTFFKIVDQSRVFLYHGILNHKIFKSHDLWDAIYFESLHEEMKKQEGLRSKEQTPDSIQREKNTIFGFLASLVQNMSTFGQDKKEVGRLLEKYAKKVYQLPEVQFKQLLALTG